MSKNFKCSVNFGLAGQLNEDSLFDALMGVKFDVTTSSSDWGHGDSPVRHYLTGFLFVDTTKLPLIDKNNGRVVTLKRMRHLPDTRELLFGKAVINRKAVVGVWEPESVADTNGLLSCLRNCLGYTWLGSTVRTASQELLEKIELRVGTAIMAHQKASSAFTSAVAAANKAEEDKDLTEETIRMVARTKAVMSSAGNRVSELERALGLWKRKLDGATSMPEGISLIVVQVNPDEVKEDEIPGHYVIGSTPALPAPRVLPVGKNTVDAPKTKAKASYIPAVMATMGMNVRPSNRKRNTTSAHLIR